MHAFRWAPPKECYACAFHNSAFNRQSEDLRKNVKKIGGRGENGVKKKPPPIRFLYAIFNKQTPLFEIYTYFFLFYFLLYFILVLFAGLLLSSCGRRSKTIKYGNFSDPNRYPVSTIHSPVSTSQYPVPHIMHICVHIVVVLVAATSVCHIHAHPLSHPLSVGRPCPMFGCIFLGKYQNGGGSAVARR